MGGQFFIASKSGGKWSMEVAEVAGMEGGKLTCWHSLSTQLARSMP